MRQARSQQFRQPSIPTNSIGTFPLIGKQPCVVDSTALRAGSRHVPCMCLCRNGQRSYHEKRYGWIHHNLRLSRSEQVCLARCPSHWSWRLSALRGSIGHRSSIDLSAICDRNGVPATLDAMIVHGHRNRLLHVRKEWWPERDLNPRRRPFQGRALPLSYLALVNRMNQDAASWQGLLGLRQCVVNVHRSTGQQQD